MSPKADRIYLEHILECVALIKDYTRDGKAVAPLGHPHQRSQRIPMTRPALTFSALGIFLFLAPTFWLLNGDSIAQRFTASAIAQLPAPSHF
jgi:hypothetical protein